MFGTFSSEDVFPLQLCLIPPPFFTFPLPVALCPSPHFLAHLFQSSFNFWSRPSNSNLAKSTSWPRWTSWRKRSTTCQPNLLGGFGPHQTAKATEWLTGNSGKKFTCCCREWTSPGISMEVNRTFSDAFWSLPRNTLWYSDSVVYFSLWGSIVIPFFHRVYRLATHQFSFVTNGSLCKILIVDLVSIFLFFVLKLPQVFRSLFMTICLSLFLDYGWHFELIFFKRHSTLQDDEVYRFFVDSGNRSLLLLEFFSWLDQIFQFYATMERSWEPSYVAVHGESTEWSYDKLLKDVLCSKETTVQFLLGCGVLKSTTNCPKCHQPMKLSRCLEADFTEGFFFRCQRKSLDWESGGGW